MTITGLTPEELEIFESWHDDPDLFDRDVWPDALPEKWQTEASGLIAKRDRVAIRSGHGVGKTAWLAGRIIWWGMTRHPWKVGVTAPSSGQMFDALWSELAKWHSKMPERLKSRFTKKAMPTPSRWLWVSIPNRAAERVRTREQWFAARGGRHSLHSWSNSAGSHGREAGPERGQVRRVGRVSEGHSLVA